MIILSLNYHGVPIINGWLISLGDSQTAAVNRKDIFEEDRFKAFCTYMLINREKKGFQESFLMTNK